MPTPKIRQKIIIAEQRRSSAQNSASLNVTRANMARTAFEQDYPSATTNERKIIERALELYARGHKQTLEKVFREKNIHEKDPLYESCKGMFIQIIHSANKQVQAGRLV